MPQKILQIFQLSRLTEDDNKNEIMLDKLQLP